MINKLDQLKAMTTVVADTGDIDDGAAAARGQGYGWLLADVAVQWARYRGVRRIYLLTEFASDFFAAKLGFRVVDRSTVSAAVSQTAVFHGSTDSKFVAMRLDL